MSSPVQVSGGVQLGARGRSAPSSLRAHPQLWWGLIVLALGFGAACRASNEPPPDQPQDVVEDAGDQEGSGDLGTDELTETSPDTLGSDDADHADIALPDDPEVDRAGEEELPHEDGMAEDTQQDSSDEDHAGRDDVDEPDDPLDDPLGEDADGDVGPVDPIYPPTLSPLFPEKVERSFRSFSTPTLGPRGADGSQIIYFGYGTELPFRDRPLGGVVAVSGQTNRVLWSVDTPTEVYSAPRLVPCPGCAGLTDGTPDVLVAGRRGIFRRLSGADGHQRWQASLEGLPETPVPYNFYTPAVVPPEAVAGPAVAVQVYGGNDLRGPGQARDESYVVVYDLEEGSVLAWSPTPDGSESYMSPLVLPAALGRPWRVLVGTGGETHGGGLWVVPLEALMRGGPLEEAVPLVTSPTKGFIAPPSLGDFNGDGHMDIAVNAMDGRVMVFSGADYTALWSVSHPGEEGYSSPALLRLSDGELAVFVQSLVGFFPQYAGVQSRLFRASTGELLWSQRSDASYVSSPLAFDLRGEGRDVVVFSETWIRRGQPTVSVLSFLDPSRGELHRSDPFPYEFLGAGRVGDAAGRGRLEWLQLASLHGIVPPPRGEEGTWRLLRLDLDAPPPPTLTWGGYLGTYIDGIVALPVNADR